MKTLIKYSFVFLFLMLETAMFAQKYIYDVDCTDYFDDMHFDRVRRIIRLPSVNGLLPLKCDFHIHTVFSDGEVWPTTRVTEAWQDGLDAIAITDHTYISGANPRGGLPGGPNKSYEIAKPEGERLDLIVIKGTEISRLHPDGGHFNALFITDAEKTVGLSGEEAVKEAVRQGGVIIWNHPPYPNQTYTNIMYDVNKRLIESGHIHAMEVFNYGEWYPRVLSWCRDYKLAPVAATDIHYLTSNFYRLSDKTIRPMTIVLAREKTQKAIKDALLQRQTIAFFRGMLAGSSDLLKEFFLASVSFKKISAFKMGKQSIMMNPYDAPSVEEQNMNLYLVTNPYDIPYVLELENGKKVTLHANSEITLDVPAKSKELKVKIINLHTYEHETLKVSIPLPQ